MDIHVGFHCPRCHRPTVSVIPLDELTPPDTFLTLKDLFDPPGPYQLPITCEECPEQWAVLTISARPPHPEPPPQGREE